MPRMYRVMKKSRQEMTPEVGNTAVKLGVRDGSDGGRVDLAKDNGNAPPGRGGMSVVSCIAGLRRRMKKGLCRPDMVPKRLHDAGKIPGAMGPNSLHLFRHGEGPFANGPVTAQLSLVIDGDDHGTIQPAALMPYDEYRQAIVGTRND